MTLANIVHPPALTSHLLNNPINKAIYRCTLCYCGAKMHMAAVGESLLLWLFCIIVISAKDTSYRKHYFKSNNAFTVKDLLRKCGWNYQAIEFHAILVSPAQKTIHSAVSIAALLCIYCAAADDLQHRFDVMVHVHVRH